MSKKYLDDQGLLYFWQKITSKFVAKDGNKVLSTNDYTTAEKNKLAGIADNANNYSLPTASSDTLGGVKVGSGLAINNGVLSATGGGTADSVDWSNVQNKPTALTDFTNDLSYKTTYNASTNKIATESDLPTKVSDLTNDGDGTSGSKFATESYVNTNGGKIDKIKVNGTEQTITNKTVDITVPTNTNQLTNGAGFITGIDSSAVTTALGYTPYNSTNPSGYQTSSDVETAINSKISSTYKAKGSVAFASLPSATSTNEGNVYNITDSFTTTADFVEGAGNTYPAGTNVVIINTTGSTYKYDVLAGFVDLSGYLLSSDLVAVTNGEIDVIVGDSVASS